jgi:hypothetical protein
MSRDFSLSSLNAADAAVVSNVLDIFERVWLERVPVIDTYLLMVSPSLRPVLLYELAQIEHANNVKKDLQPQTVAIADTPELQEALTAGRKMAEFAARLAPALQEVKP